MATSKNQTIQQLMNEAEALDEKDPTLEEKLQLIALKVAEEQRKVKAAAQSTLSKLNEAALVDPADEFACEGCQ